MLKSIICPIIIILREDLEEIIKNSRQRDYFFILQQF